MKYALINKETNIVDNIIELDDVNAWPCPDTHILVQDDTVAPKMLYNNGEFTAQPIVKKPETKADLLKQIQDLTAKVEAL